MTQTVLQLIELLTDKGLPITTVAALLNKKAPTEAATSSEGTTKK